MSTINTEEKRLQGSEHTSHGEPREKGTASRKRREKGDVTDRDKDNSLTSVDV